MNYFKLFEYIIIKFKTVEEVETVFDDINDTIIPRLDFINCKLDFITGLTDYIGDGDIPYLRYTHLEGFSYGTLEFLNENENAITYGKVFSINDYPYMRQLILFDGKTAPTYYPRTLKY